MFKTLSPFGYNLKEGGRGGRHSGETREKMSQSRKGEKNHMFGKKASEETREKLSAGHKGNVVSTETRLKISVAQYTPVEQWSRDGKIFIKMFESLKLAAHAIGTNRSGISMNLSGKQKTAGGFVWRRVKEKESVLINDEPVC